MNDRTEAQEQMAVMKWAEMSRGKYPELRLLFHIANGGSRNKIEAAHLKQQGVKAGVPDLCLPVARGRFHGLYIEMKREKGGRLSPEQKGWLNALEAQGYYCKVCHGASEAIHTIQDYLRGE